MLNVEKYISSGIVESYVMGIADDRDMLEFEQLLPHYPELRLAMNSFEYELERSALDNAIAPPVSLWPSIERRVTFEKEPVRPRNNGNGGKQSGADDVIPIISTDNQIRVHKNWRTAFILLFILSKLLLFFVIYYYLLYKQEVAHREKLEEQLLKVDKKIVSPAGTVISFQGE